MRFFKLALITFFIINLASCFSQKNIYDGRPVIIATTGMIADIVRNVGGDFVIVQTLMAPGIDPHTYKASEGDVIKIASANVIFHNGLHLEGKLGEVLNRARNSVSSYAISQYIPGDKLIMVEANVPDPHIWFDPLLWIYAVNRVTDTLVDMDPVNAVYYRKNENNYIQELMALHTQIQNILNQVPESQRVLVTSHDAFSYFGKAYGWEVIGIQGINTASETSVYNIQSLAKTIVERKIPCIFTETSVSSRSVDALIASTAAMGTEVRLGGSLYSDSIGHSGSGADTYIGMLRANAEIITSGILNR